MFVLGPFTQFFLCVIFNLSNLISHVCEVLKVTLEKRETWHSNTQRRAKDGQFSLWETFHEFCPWESSQTHCGAASLPVQLAQGEINMGLNGDVF